MTAGAPLGASTAAARLQHIEQQQQQHTTTNNNSFRENFALKMQTHNNNMRTSNSSGSISGIASTTTVTSNNSPGGMNMNMNNSTPMVGTHSTHSTFTNNSNVGHMTSMSYAPPVHTTTQQQGGSDGGTAEQQFTVYPSSNNKGTTYNNKSYTYIGSGSSGSGDDPYKQGALLMEQDNANNNSYTTMDYLKEVGSECFDSCHANVSASPRWVKMGVGAFLCLWVLIVLGEHHYEKHHQNSSSSPSKGDDSGGGNSDNSGSSSSTRNHNAMLHDCAAVGNYYFGDPVFEFNGHSYQLIGDIVHYNITNPHGGGFSFFDALAHSRSRCVGGKPGYLASIESEEENTFLANKVREVLNSAGNNVSSLDDHNTINVWLGGNDMTNSANFEWLSANAKSDGTVFWKYRQPVSGVYSNFGINTNSSGGTNCVRMRVADATAQWMDESCYKKLAFAFVEYDAMLVP